MRNTPASPERIGRYRRGRVSEWLAAAALLAQGLPHPGAARAARPMARSTSSPCAAAGWRSSRSSGERRGSRAEAAITPRQAGRIARAAEFWVSRNPAYREHEQGLDVVFVTPGRLPVHVPDALQGMRGDQRNPR